LTLNIILKNSQNIKFFQTTGKNVLDLFILNLIFFIYGPLFLALRKFFHFKCTTHDILEENPMVLWKIVPTFCSANLRTVCRIREQYVLHQSLCQVLGFEAICLNQQIHCVLGSYSIFYILFKLCHFRVFFIKRGVE